ncbi:MAG: potassium-transporting ATPase subunit C [Caulobacteraceae bacterium]
MTPSASSGSNYGPLNADLIKREKGDADALRAGGVHTIPADARHPPPARASIPEISPAYALVQADRVAAARGVPADQVRKVIAAADQVRKVIAAHVQAPFLGFIGQPRVNVLMTNLALDAALPKGHPAAS